VPYVSNKEIIFIKKVIENKSFAGNNEYSKRCETLLEKKYNFNKCYLTPSCTAAIEMAALILDLKINDEIIVPSYTFASCPNPFLINGAKIVLADCEKDYPNISAHHVETLISPKTKAIMVMHYGGVACDIDEIKAICNKNKLFLIEDAAQCINSYYHNKPLGSFGDIGVFSFHETKNITCGEGGLIVINNPKLLKKAETVRQYGTNRTNFIQNNLSHYESVGKGLALFQSEINAAFLYAQLQAIDLVAENRKQLWNYYYNQLSKLASNLTFSLPQINANTSTNNHTFFITLKDKKDTNPLIDFLGNNDIVVVKHFYPLHQSKFYSKKHNGNNFLNATRFNNTLIRLPLHHYLTFKDIDFIVERIGTYFLLKNKF